MATTWIAIADDDLDNYLVAAQVTAAQSTALKLGQSDTFANVMADVIAKMRMQIASCDNNQLSSVTNSIPPSLKSTACWLIVAMLNTRLPGLDFDDNAKARIAEADKTMVKVANCDYAIETPSAAIDPGVQDGGQLEIVQKSIRVATRDKLAGL